MQCYVGFDIFLVVAVVIVMAEFISFSLWLNDNNTHLTAFVWEYLGEPVRERHLT